MLCFWRPDNYPLRRDVVEAVDVEGCDWVSGHDDVGIFQGPFQPDAKEMPLDPAIAMLRILEEFQLVDFESCLAGLTVCVSSQGIV